MKIIVDSELLLDNGWEFEFGFREYVLKKEGYGIREYLVDVELEASESDEPDFKYYIADENGGFYMPENVCKEIK